MERKLIVLCGPTASGKSACAVDLCRRVGGAVVSCDSMQLYRGMDIGTAKPTEGEMRGIPHLMLDVLEPGEACSAARYRELVLPLIDQRFEQGVQPVLCGGTGLYINALTKPLGFSIKGDDALRAELEQLPRKTLHDMLAGIDPASAARLHMNDTRRVVRAIEVYKLTGKTLTEQMSLDQARPADYPARLFALSWPRERLYARIDARVDEMIGAGLVNEVKNLLNNGLSIGSTAMQAIGYKEIAQALSGAISMDEAVSLLKQATRNYAKRQLTWFTQDARVCWVSAEDRSISEITDEIINNLEGKTR